jgi:hypothetical protein
MAPQEKKKLKSPKLTETPYFRSIKQLRWTAQTFLGQHWIEMNDSRLPDFGGLKLAAARQIAAAREVDSTRDFLNLCHRRLAER